MNLAKNLAAEIKKLDERRATLADDVERARGELDAARAGLVAGKVKVAEVTATQSTHAALSETLPALDRTITATRARLDEARSAEQRAADVMRVRKIGEEKARLTGELQAIFERANEALIDVVAAHTARTTRWVELTREMDAITERRTGFDPSRQRSSPLSDLQLAPVLPFGAAIAVAIQMEDNRLHTERRNDIRRRDAERRQARELAARGDEPRAVPSVYSQTEAARTGFYVQPSHAGSVRGGSMSETESIEILSDAGEVLASAPLPADLLTEGGTGEIRDFKTSMKVERDGRAA
jgi:hypothetical protein